jgi:hypothetical protein
MGRVKGEKTMWGHWQFDMSGDDQEKWQIWLRTLPEQYRGEVWDMLHGLSYTDNWSDKREHERVAGGITAGVDEIVARNLGSE